jgi:hypothetical protein
MPVTLKKGKGHEWEISIRDEKGLIAGIHYSSDRKVTRKQKDIIEAALRVAVEELGQLPTLKGAGLKE